MCVRIRLLGPVCAWRLGRRIGLGAPAQRAVLGLLALAGGQPLARADLVEALWADRPPPSAANMIQTYLKQLRRLLEPDRQARARSTVLPMVGDGYALRLPPEDIDALRFRRLVAAAGADSDPHHAAALLGEALAMWAGAPFCDLPVLSGHPKVLALSAERQSALAGYGEALIAVGAAEEAVAVLTEASATQPLNEAVRALLIRAHLATGQRARARAVYRDIRRRLAEELGVDPGPQLRTALHGGPRSHPHHGPAQLPAGEPDFTGRTAELAELDRLVAVGVAVVSGPAGTGKTALALRWAHRVRHRFPDGQLYATLRGHDAVGEALTRFLVALGVPAEHVPLDVAERAGRYRTELAGRRVLVVLDDAATSDQVRPLLPGSADCAVVVTSRDSLTGLIARHGARRLDLDGPPPGRHPR